MDISAVADLAPDLSGLEVALLLSLSAREHCLIETTEDAIHDVARELALISSNTFNLSFAILDCSSDTSLDNFCKEVLDSARGLPQSTRLRTDSLSNLSRLQTAQESDRLSGGNVVNVVLAKNFNHAPERIQLHALELVRSKKLVAQSATLNAPPDFLFVSLVARNSDQLHPRLNAHLNDHLFISHFHGPDDGYTYLEEGGGWLSDEKLSASSVLKKPDIQMEKKYPKVNSEALESFRQASKSVGVGADVARYIQDIVVFLRLSRGVAGTISSTANKHFQQFARLLSLLHGLDYLTPSIVALAARKVFRHRIIVARPEDDRSLQYGSDIKTVSMILGDVTPDSILDNVLELEGPL
ncbi:hypothetical protein PHISP_06815 [Aspergillus sp. HF37]|nr:hypothetical protein PHISP_06815 [Aspergillus sp. HF37]